MKNFRPYFVALGLAAAALSSCGRSYYSFQSKAPAYLGTAPTAAVPVADAAPAVATRPVAQSATVSATRENLPVASPTVAPIAVTRPAEVPAAASPAVAASPAQALRLPAGQRLLLRHVLRQANRATARQQNTAGVAHTAATKGSFVIALVGLVALLIGIIASSGFLITVGIIAIVVGIVLFILKVL